MNNKDLAAKVLKLVGGKSNIKQLTHCFTRLRFVLKDESKADIKKLDKLEGVLRAQVKGGQVQVVLGAKVADVYKEVCVLADIQASQGAEVEEEGTKTSLFNRFIQIIVGIFTPIIPALAGAGLIKSLVVILNATGIVDPASGFITILTMIGASVFYFIPFFLAVGAARVFKTKESMALALAAGLMHPTILNSAPGVASGEVATLDFLGLPLLLFNYSNSVLPIILSVWILSYVYKYVNKWVPEFLRVVLTPIVVLLIMIPLELIAIAPLGTYLGNLMSSGINGFFAVGGIFAGAVLGFFRPILVMFGMHYSLIPIQIQQIGQQGFTLLMPSALAANFAQAGAALGVFFVAKNKSTKSVAASTAVPAVFGITEPAIYGINLKYKKPFFAGCIAAAITSGFFIIVNARTVAPGLPGLLSLANNEADKFIYIIIGVAMAFGLSCLFTVIAGIDEEDVEDEVSAEGPQDVINLEGGNEQVLVMSPVVGEIKALSEVDDKTFSQGLLGKGVAIEPAEGKVFAPFDGTVEVLMKTKHAIALKDETGVEVLIHIGMDTVNLKGEHFTAHVEQGQKVKAGQLLVEFDIEAIKKAGFATITPVIVINSDEYLDVIPTASGPMTERLDLMTVFI